MITRGKRTFKNVAAYKAYKEACARGGRNGHIKGFSLDPELARQCGRVGGKLSKRKPKPKI